MLAALRTIIFAVLFFVLSWPFIIVAFVASRTSPRLLLATAKQWSRFHLFCCRWLLGISIRIDGELSEQPALYAIKHESMFETIDMPRFFNHPTIIAKKQLFSIPLWGRAALAFGMIPIDREGGARALREMLSKARAAVEAGKPIIIFPEGTRVAHGSRPKLQSGFAGLYKMLKLPVIPIAVDSGRLSPMRNRFWQSGTITYKIGEVIPAGLPREEIESRVHTAINALNAPDA